MICVEALKAKAIKEHKVEVVERKGKGHPDYICDSIMDAISVALCERYMGEFGTILHHNIDKGLLAAGRVEKRFGGGKLVMIYPWLLLDLLFCDRKEFTLTVYINRFLNSIGSFLYIFTAFLQPILPTTSIAFLRYLYCLNSIFDSISSSTKELGKL
jgi:hypothetical protein